MSYSIENMLRKGPYFYNKQVKKDCETLFNQLSMTAFGYARIDRDGKSFTLCTNPKHYEKYYLASVFKKDPCCNRATSKLQPVNLWIGILNRNDPEQEAVYRQQVEDDLFNGVCLKFETDNGYETFDFATNIKDTEVLSRFVSNLNQVYDFISYFKLKYREKIQNACDDFINMGELVGESFYESGLTQSEPFTTLNKKENQYEVIIDGRLITLTKREAQCLYHLCQGKSAKETGNLIHLSQRTIETYIEKLRYKTLTRSKINLVSKIDRSQLSKLKLIMPQIEMTE